MDGALACCAGGPGLIHAVSVNIKQGEIFMLFCSLSDNELSVQQTFQNNEKLILGIPAVG